ncbi:quinate 5-dehydrogenase [Desulfotomaculum sp. 1211_IL3151]|uniref:quinate 5-dehydrogenase n=1 Tax=Desulfotomaculum sp. 1211_IL3151 TaxID=3084055 RepID=UPI002FDA5D91
MKKVVSVSLGSSKRNHLAQVELLGEQFEISRVGTDGDMYKAKSILRELDGKVDAIGLGGIDVYLYAGKTRYVLQDGLRLLETVKKTPVVDGSGLKNTLERQAVIFIKEQGLIKQNTRVLMVSAMDRFGMAEAFSQSGCQLTIGDLIFALGIPIPIYNLDKLHSMAEKLMPIISRLPFKLFYPTGQRQEKQHNSTKYSKYYDKAQIIAGDYHFIYKYLPERLKGQVILTNTTTQQDVEELMERGAGALVTTTPSIQGRTFGTNVMEAVFLALLNKTWEEVTVDDYTRLLKELDWQPTVTWLKKESKTSHLPSASIRP